MWTTINRVILQPLDAWRTGSQHLRYLKELEQTQYDPTEVIRHRQWIRVRQLIQHAYDTVPYYRRIMDSRGLHPSDIRSLSDLSLLPILTKQNIRDHETELLSSAFSKDRLTLKRTSGSTGVPLSIRVNRQAIEWKTACTLRSDMWSGYRRGGRVAKVWGNPEYLHHGWKGKLRNWLLDRAIYLDTLHVDDARMQAFTNQLRAAPPSLLFGHAHSLYLYACYLRRTKQECIRPDGIISTAMLLHRHERQVIEEVFGRPVTDRYGCEETSLIASACEVHHGLHLNADSVYAELRPGLDGTSGQLLLTDLTNMAMPLIRYQVGDVVLGSERTCSCGRGLPMIESIQGREADYVLTPSRRLISGISLTENFALKITGAAQVQIVQEKIDFLRVRLVRDERFNAQSHRQIRELVQATFGDEMAYEVEFVDRIPQERSGKYRFCISPIANDYMKALSA